MKVVVHVDGGARGNPGPAAAAAVLSTPDGDVLDEAHELLGVVTNNVAEYRALLLGLARARALGADEVEVVNDSELVARQVNGEYKVKHPDMRPLYAEALRALRDFDALEHPLGAARAERRRRRAGQPGARQRRLKTAQRSRLPPGGTTHRRSAAAAARSGPRSATVAAPSRAMSSASSRHACATAPMRAVGPQPAAERSSAA